MNRLFKILSGFGILAFPTVVALAQNLINTTGENPGGTNAFSILGVVSNIFGVLIPILVTFAVIYIIVGVIKYATANDDDAQASARKSIISGIIALFVIVSIWGLVAVLNSTFGIGQSGSNVGACQPVYNPVSQSWEVPPQCQ